MIRTIAWIDDAVVMIDQRALPLELSYHTCRRYEDVAAAIRNMTVRGAPAVGVAAAMGIALGMNTAEFSSPDDLENMFTRLCDEFAATRPTAVNLFWAIRRMKSCFAAHHHENMAVLCRALKDEALLICEEDQAINRKIGENGKSLIGNGDTILTHCNAGALATADYGTALGVIRAARDEGKDIHVFIDETRPVLQGARLTAWEMVTEKIPATLITDNMAGFVMQQGRIDCILVGADRIASNGDVANKIGTYSLAILAREHGIPFYVAAPLSTIDAEIQDGSGIPIEERNKLEILEFGGVRVAPEGIGVYNPAFDITPNSYVTAIITEKGLLRPPFEKAIAAVFSHEKDFPL